VLVAGDVIAAFLYGVFLSLIPVVISLSVIGAPVHSPLLLAAIVLSAFCFAVLGSLFSPPHRQRVQHYDHRQSGTPPAYLCERHLSACDTDGSLVQGGSRAIAVDLYDGSGTQRLRAVGSFLAVGLFAGPRGLLRRLVGCHRHAAQAQHAAKAKPLTWLEPTRIASQPITPVMTNDQAAIGRVLRSKAQAKAAHDRMSKWYDRLAGMCAQVPVPMRLCYVSVLMTAIIGCVVMNGLFGGTM